MVYCSSFIKKITMNVRWMETCILSVLNRRMDTLERCFLKCRRKLAFQRWLISILVEILNSENQRPIEVDSEEESQEEIENMEEEFEVPNAPHEIIAKYHLFLRLCKLEGCLAVIRVTSIRKYKFNCCFVVNNENI